MSFRMLLTLLQKEHAAGIICVGIRDAALKAQIHMR